MRCIECADGWCPLLRSHDNISRPIPALPRPVGLPTLSKPAIFWFSAKNSAGDLNCSTSLLIPLPGLPLPAAAGSLEPLPPPPLLFFEDITLDGRQKMIHNAAHAIKGLEDASTEIQVVRRK